MQSHPYCNSYTVENSFSLFIEQNINSARIKMFLLKDPINTADIPSTYDILQNFLPSVLTTECFNDQNLPFSLEVKRTEIGHLFEHVLLEYMCHLKIGKGYKSAAYSGRTRWNWEKDPRGVFHIHINCTLKDADILPIAMDKTIALMKMILLCNQSLSSLNVLSARPNEGLKNGKKLSLPSPAV